MDATPGIGRAKFQSRGTQWQAARLLDRTSRLFASTPADDLTAILHQVGAYTPPWLS